MPPFPSVRQGILSVRAARMSCTPRPPLGEWSTSEDSAARSHGAGVRVDGGAARTRAGLLSWQLPRLHLVAKPFLDRSEMSLGLSPESQIARQRDRFVLILIQAPVIERIVF